MQYARLVAGLVLALLAGVGPAAAGRPAPSPDGPNRAALVVDYADGRLDALCIPFSEEAITGEELLGRSALPVLLDYSSGIGGAVCSIDGAGCTYPREPCWCRCSGQSCAYWSYWHLQDGTWVYAMTGASGHAVVDGAVEGWAWGSGDASSAPPPISFEEICGALPTPAISFWADAYRLERGQCTTLRWDVSDARAVYLAAGAGPWIGVPARSTMQVCPERTTGYVLRAFAEDTVQTRALTIRVAAPQAYLPLVLKGSWSPGGTMVLIPAGTFQMGCDAMHNGGHECMPDELPLHTVYLDAFAIDTMKVTNGQYARCVAPGSCTPPADYSSFTRPLYYENPDYSDYPVIHVTWEQAKAYCEWLDKRLPTEAEWEKAARGVGAARAYPWGDAAPTCALANFAPAAACIGDTTAVASYPLGASPYGVLDMAGNVREWVNDWYQADYYQASPPANPSGPATGCYKCSRGVRGSTWYDASRYLRTARRGYLLFAPHERADVGFRCAATP